MVSASSLGTALLNSQIRIRGRNVIAFHRCRSLPSISSDRTSTSPGTPADASTWLTLSRVNHSALITGGSARVAGWRAKKRWPSADEYRIAVKQKATPAVMHQKVGRHAGAAVLRADFNYGA